MGGKDEEHLAAVVIQQLEESANVKLQLVSQARAIVQIAQVWTSALQRGNKILFCGNGGSAADSQHLAAELVGRFARERDAVPAIALTTDTSILTAISNDYGYEHVFERQVGAYGRRGDVLVGISTSGESQNVILAMEKARELGVTTVAFTGLGGRLKDLADYSARAVSNNTARIQETHITIGHIICGLVEEVLCGQPSNPETGA